jgi:TRAP-type C4-dicarboxylate transport system substrate-binding protein
MLSGSAAAMALQREDALEQEWAEHNVKIINVSQPGAGNALLCTKPIDSAEQARGMRVFSGGGVWNAEVEALGMVPVHLPAPETYEALQRGVIDCATAAPSTLVSFDWWDVAKHYIPVSMSAFNGSAQVINLDVWNRLPPDAQAIITEAAHTWWTGINKETLASYSGFAVDGPSKHGVVVHDPAPLDAVLKQRQAKAIAALPASAPPTVADPQGLIDTYKSLLDEWMTKATETLGVPPSPRDPAAIQQSYASGAELDFSRFDEITDEALFPVEPTARTEPR